MQRIALIMLFTSLLCAGAEAQTQLLRTVAGSGGVSASGSTYMLLGTVGQPVAGWTTGASQSAGLGFWYRSGEGTDAIGETTAAAEGLELGANYPNPFGPGSATGATATRLEFHLESGGHAMLTVYDLMGQQRAVIVDERLEAGRYVAVLRAAELPSGIYICRLVQGTRHSERRLLLLR